MDMSASQLVIHPLIVRITHWINAFAMGCMIMSGWQIYNANPLFGFTFPTWATLGGWLGGAIAWHLAAMWLLVCNGLIYMIWGLVRRHFARNFGVPAFIRVEHRAYLHRREPGYGEDQPRHPSQTASAYPPRFIGHGYA